MKVEMIMPQMGESIAEATISKWLKNVGDKVEKDQSILEISTDKVDSEIPAPATGVITEILYKQGDVVPVKTKIAMIETDAAAAATQPASKAASPSPVAATPATSAAAPQTLVSVFSNPANLAAAPAGAVAHAQSGAASRFYSPLVMTLAAKHGVSLAELEQIVGSGTGGRVNKNDLLGFVDNRSRGGAGAGLAGAPSCMSNVVARAAETQPVATAKSQGAAGSGPVSLDGSWGADGTKVVMMDNMRQLIAEHMVKSKQTSPHVYSIQEVDMSRVAKWRGMHKDSFKKKEGFNLSFTPFFLEAAVKGLVEFPIVNARVDGKKIIYNRHVNLGCAVALGNTGLIVPVIKQAEERNIVGLARGLNDLAERARSKKLAPTDVQGGTFTVTNPGVFGTIIGTPIINQPQSAILCLGAIKKRAVVVDDMIAIREICYLTLSYDHRIIDGSAAGQFLQFICQYLENWDMERGL
jgi:2-oxoglutarate dehydrogenase E2 component (dihydrolipoamide succinyltransferase)